MKLGKQIGVGALLFLAAELAIALFVSFGPAHEHLFPRIIVGEDEELLTSVTDTAHELSRSYRYRGLDATALMLRARTHPIAFPAYTDDRSDITRTLIARSFVNFKGDIGNLVVIGRRGKEEREAYLDLPIIGNAPQKTLPNGAIFTAMFNTECPGTAEGSDAISDIEIADIPSRRMLLPHLFFPVKKGTRFRKIGTVRSRYSVMTIANRIDGSGSCAFARLPIVTPSQMRPPTPTLKPVERAG